MITEGRENYRVFINVGSSACPARCTYCYVPPGRSQPFPDAAIRSGLESLCAQASFRAGREGTILTFGGHTDLFLDRALAAAFLRVLPLATAWGNPIQLSTKGLISHEDADAIAAATYAGQITAFIACATTARAAEFEPSAPTPERRWANFSTLASRGIASGLLIKPWLGEATARSLSTFAEVLCEHRVRAACLGGIFISDAIRARIGFLPEGRHAPGERHPFGLEMDSAIQPPKEQFDTLQHLAPDTLLFGSSLCVTAMFARRKCPLHPGGECSAR